MLQPLQSLMGNPADALLIDVSHRVDTDLTGAQELAQYKLQPVAGVSWFGPTDFRDQDLFVVPEGVKKEYDPWHWTRRITKHSGNIYEDKSEKTLALIKEVSPVVYLKKESPPLLQVHEPFQ